MDKNKMVSWCVVVLTAALISVFFLSAPANAGVSPEDGALLGDGEWAIIGETNLSFVNKTGWLIPNGTIRCIGVDIISDIPFEGPFDSSHYEDELALGNCRVISRLPEYGEISVSFLSPKLDVKTKVHEEYFDWVTRGGNITFEAVTNLWVIAGPLPNNISYKLLDPYGVPVQLFDVNGVPLVYLDVSGGDVFFLPLNTAGMRTGMYTFSIETDPATNNGLDAEGPSVSFEVRSKGVTIEANKEKQTVTEDIVFTCYTTPYTEIRLDVTWGMPSKVKFFGVTPPIIGWSDEDGKFIAEASFTDTGSYEITATESIANTTDGITVEIVQFEAEVKTDKSVYHIGENVEITGSATAGENIVIKIDDEVVKWDADKEGFDYTWRTTEETTPGSHKIAIWVSPFSDPFLDSPDDSVSIILLRGGLFAKASTDFVAQGDDFTIDGAAPGRDQVDILTISPKGGSGRGFDPNSIFKVTNGSLKNTTGLTFSTCGITTDGTFETEKIAVDKKVDTGTYLIAVLNYGRDGVWGTSGSDNLLEVISNNYASPKALAIKTTDQILAILKDKTINAAGTDDLLGIATIKVEKGFVTLDDIDAVALNEEIKVTGTTNRQVGTSIIVTVEGLDEKTPKLKPKITKVKEDPDNFYNKFFISFATASANIGAYEVTVDDGDGHVATTTMNILLAVEPSVNVSATSTPTPIVEPEGKSESASAAAATPRQTPTPTAIEETETEKEPGFEAVFSIAVLLVVTWLMLRTRQQRQRKDKKR